MSRVGMKPIEIPAGVTVAVSGDDVTVKGPKGELTLVLPKGISATVDGNIVNVARPDDTKISKSMHGLGRSLIANMVIGVSEGYLKELQLEGVGYKAEMSGSMLVISAGLSHQIEFETPEGIEIKAGGSSISISGADKQCVGDTAARIRSFRPPEPYKGKGIRYKGEHIRRKAGKTVA